MEDTSGFYKWDDDQQEWLWGPNKVININYVLERELHNTYSYPIDGWYWYDEKPNLKNTLI
jgi:hypothetical protein